MTIIPAQEGLCCTDCYCPPPAWVLPFSPCVNIVLTACTTPSPRLEAGAKEFVNIKAVYVQ